MLRRLLPATTLPGRHIHILPSKPRGMKKDEAQYLVSPSGETYPPKPDVLKPVMDFLGQWTVPEPLALQAVTHKSFAHGKKPYNEKLAHFGQQLLRMQTNIDIAHQKLASSQHLENGCNFDVTQRAVEILSSSAVLAEICAKAGLGPSLFFRPAKPGQETTVYAKTICALVGAVLLQHGIGSARNFVNTRLLNGPNSLYAVSDKLYIK